jgi:hypothetical protein
MYKKQPFKSKTMTILAIALISSIFLLNSTIAGNSDARKMGPYSCTPVGSSVTKCCAVDLETTRTWCTFCNDTTPPSGCLSADPINNEGNDNTIPESPGGGVLNNEEESGESEDTNPKNMGDNVLNDGSSSGSSESGSFDPDKVVGGGFNQ